MIQLTIREKETGEIITGTETGQFKGHFCIDDRLYRFDNYTEVI